MTSILIADDSMLIRAWLGRLLPDMGHQVAATAASGAEAVHLAGVLRPDLVLMDVRMPGELDGLAAGERIRSTLDIPVVYMTAHTGEDVLGRIMDASPPGFVTKPIHPPQLRLTLEIALRHKAEGDLAAANARFRVLADNARDMIFRYRFADETYEYVNSAITDITGYTPDDLRQDPRLLFRIIHPDSQAYLEMEWGRFLQGDIAPTYEYRIVHADGAPRWLFQRNMPVHDASGRLVALDGMVTDVTGHKALEQRLRRDLESADAASRAKTRFLGRVGHELRTPLNSILGMCEVLAEAPLPPAQQECVAAISQSGEFLSHLINEILDLSRLDSGHVALGRAPLDPAALLGRAADAVLPKARAKGLRLVVRTGSDLPALVLCDATAIGRVLDNLADNAVRFTRRGMVELCVDRWEAPSQGSRLVFRVRDTGVGIDPRDQDRIFEPFATSPQTPDAKPGSGLGLAVAARLADMLGGDIRVESRPGLGSLFTFTVPVGLPGDPPPAPSAPPETAPLRETAVSGADGARRILVAEDNPANRNVIALYLEDSPYIPDMAANGAEAVALFRPGAYAAVLMDIDMPIMDGFAATRELRRMEAQAAAAPTPVIALTAHDLPEIRRLMEEAGCTDFLVKPVRKARLLAAMAAPAAAPGPFLEIASEPCEPPPEVLRLLPAFFEIQQRNLAKMRQALARADCNTLRIMGHGLRGAALTYGMPGMAACGTDIERAAAAGETGDMGGLLDRLEKEMRLRAAVHLPGQGEKHAGTT